jgi:hypothetical protein
MHKTHKTSTLGARFVGFVHALALLCVCHRCRRCPPRRLNHPTVPAATIVAPPSQSPRYACTCTRTIKQAPGVPCFMGFVHVLAQPSARCRRRRCPPRPDPPHHLSHLTVPAATIVTAHLKLTHPTVSTTLQCPCMHKTHKTSTLVPVLWVSCTRWHCYVPASTVVAAYLDSYLPCHLYHLTVPARSGYP